MERVLKPGYSKECPGFWVLIGSWVFITSYVLCPLYRGSWVLGPHRLMGNGLQMVLGMESPQSPGSTFFGMPKIFKYVIQFIWTFSYIFCTICILGFATEIDQINSYKNHSPTKFARTVLRFRLPLLRSSETDSP